MKSFLIEISEEAEEDLSDAFLWYEDQLPGLGYDFIRYFDDDLNRLESFPESFPIVFKNLRKCVLKKFPFITYYKYNKQTNQIIVVRVLHSKREQKRHLR